MNKTISGSMLDKIYSELRASKLPLFIWGVGSMSKEVENCLRLQGIKIDGFFVDYEIGDVRICKRNEKVYYLKEIEEMYEKINVVIGHGHYEKRDSLKTHTFIEKIYIIANPYLQYRSKGISKYVSEHEDEINSIMEYLVDDKSRNALKAYCEVNETDNINCLLDKDFCIDGMFGFEQLCLTDDEDYVDIGAWVGDTIELFLNKTNGQYSSIAAIEADPNNFMALKENMKGKKNISFIPYGVGKEEGVLYLDRESTQSSYLADRKEDMSNKKQIEVRAIDSIFSTKKVSLIKICIPFMFLDVLQGSCECIVRNKPRLIINVAVDNGVKVFDTIKWLHNLGIGYNVALRFDFPMPTRLHIYAF